MKNRSDSDLAFLGKRVKVIMDRPMHSLHPNYGFVYEVNYGYKPDTMANDGMEKDAYVLGETEPLLVFEGIVKAVILRKNDIENKLIVTRVDFLFTEKEIMSLTNFQEQFFDIEVIMDR